MKCRICARECPPGAKLCRDCAAARKRAFAATVTQPLFAAAGAPSVGRPRFAPRPARRRPASKPAATPAGRSEAVMAASAADRVAAPRAPGVKWLLLALAIASAVVYLLIRVFFAPHAQSTAEETAPAGTGSELAPPAVSEGASAAPPVPAQLPSAAGEGAAESKPSAGAALKEAIPKTTRRKVASKVAPPVAVPVPPPPAPPEPAPIPRSPPPPVVVAPQDPWQAMNDGLSRCAKGDWFKRNDCEQRLRLQYCPGHWGLVWQCPIGPATDHGS
jgi:hypothetical protein